MLKNVVILFLVVYPLYVLFSRQPDYFDGQMYRAVIHHVYDSAQKKETVKAVYTLEKHTYSVPADYPLTYFTEGEIVPVIYEEAAPENGSIYTIWGYWIRWKEMFSFIVILAFLYLLAVSITSHPTPESLLEELEGNQHKPRKRRYDD